MYVSSQRYVLHVDLDLCTLSCRFILRNHILQTAIEQAEKGDYSEVYPLLHIYIRVYIFNVRKLPTKLFGTLHIHVYV